MSALTPEERIAAAEAKRAELRAAHAAAHAEQYAADFEKVVELEEQHGVDRVLRIDIGGWKSGSGAATLVVARVPNAKEALWKRFEETTFKAKQGDPATLKAAQVLADACLVYPSKKEQPDLYEATIDLAPGLLAHVAGQIAKAVQGKAEEEKKD